MGKERKITAPEGYEIEKVELIDGAAVVTFREKERKLPKSWEEFCEMFPIKAGECYIEVSSAITEYKLTREQRTAQRRAKTDPNVLPDRATAEAVLALCQLILLRDCYNGDWVPDWGSGVENKYCIDFAYGDICTCINCVSPLLLYFKTEELRDEFLKYFRPLIEKLKPLYGIKEGGEK